MGSLVDALNAYKGRRILVTGHTGFKGSWLAFWLTQLGAEVYGLSKDVPTEPSHFKLLKLDELIHHELVDLRDEQRVLQTFDRIRPEFVFHLAAQATVRRSYSDPKETFDTNVGGAVNLLEAIRAIDCVRVLVFITSDKCYRNIETTRGYREDDSLGGVDPYSCSKASAEHVFSAYHHSFFAHREHLGSATTRAGNVIGGGDWAADRIVPDCIRSLRAGSPIRIRSPYATRPWQHVLEPLSGYLMLGARLLTEPQGFSGPWNFGPSSTASQPVERVVQKAIQVWGAGDYEVTDQSPHLHESTLLHLDSTKAMDHLQWHVRWDFDEMLQQTVGWYKSWSSGVDVRTLTASQIAHYVDKQRD